MSFRKLLGLAALTTMLGLVLSATAQAQYAPAQGNGRVSASRINPGDCVTFSGDGFAPGSSVSITDNGTSVGTATANAAGTFSTQVCISVLGNHVLRGTGQTIGGTSRVVSARVVVSRGLVRTGTSATLPLLLGGMGLVAVGSGAVVVGRRRRRTAS